MWGGGGGIGGCEEDTEITRRLQESALESGVNLAISHDRGFGRDDKHTLTLVGLEESLVSLNLRIESVAPAGLGRVMFSLAIRAKFMKSANAFNMRQ